MARLAPHGGGLWMALPLVGVPATFYLCKRMWRGDSARTNLRGRLDDYGEFMRQRLLAAFAYDPRAFVRAQQARVALRRQCDAIFERIDLLSTPAQPDVAPMLGSLGSLTFTAPFNILGWPAISVPSGTSADGLPFGLQLVGKPWDEATVLRAAQVVEAGS